MSYQDYEPALMADESKARKQALKTLASDVRRKEQEVSKALAKFNAAEEADYTVAYSINHDQDAVTFDISGLLIVVPVSK